MSSDTNRLSWMKQSRHEIIIYLAVWGLLFAAPLLSVYVRTISDPSVTFAWKEVLLVWRHIAVYLLLFLSHNFLLAPLLVHKHKRVAYFSLVAVVLLAFSFYQCSHKPGESLKPGFHQPDVEQPGRHQPPPFDEGPWAKDGQRPPLPGDELPQGFQRPPHDLRPADAPPPFIGEHDIVAIVLLILMFAANIGIKGYALSREDHRRLAELERQNLEQQLEYLRYQINPHFFMNTLNNIHALVDIDPEQAKETIVELSKMMRYVLYEGNKQGVPLSSELEFIRHYVTLMQLRFTENVKIELELPGEVPDRKVPPLILITFIENAFKHGVSYQRESFINVNVTVQDSQLQFICSNSKTEQPNREKGGVGLANARKRLDLLFGSNYTLHIDDTSDVYSVELTLPLNIS